MFVVSSCCFCDCSRHANPSERCPKRTRGRLPARSLRGTQWPRRDLFNRLLSFSREAVIGTVLHISSLPRQDRLIDNLTCQHTTARDVFSESSWNRGNTTRILIHCWTDLCRQEKKILSGITVISAFSSNCGWLSSANSTTSTKLREGS